MLYSNVEKSVETLTLDFGELRVVSLGEKGRGRKIINLCVPQSVEKISAGLDPEISVGLTKSQKPRIVEGGRGLFVLIDTKAGYTRRGDGTVRCQHPECIKVLASGNSADGDAGRIGTAAARVIEVLEPVWLRVRMGGAVDAESRYFLYCDPKAEKPVVKVPYGHMADAMDAGMPVPENWGDIESWQLV